jgi:hypothetical protein
MRRVLAAALALLPVAALACGYCVEDRVAAVYDHAVIVRALERGHEVAFLAVDGPLADGVAQRRMIESSLRAAGADRGSVRVSITGAAVSFAYDPARKGLGPIVRAFEKKVTGEGLSVSLLRVVNESDRPR